MMDKCHYCDSEVTDPYAFVNDKYMCDRCMSIFQDCNDEQARYFYRKFDETTRQAFSLYNMCDVLFTSRSREEIEGFLGKDGFMVIDSMRKNIGGII